MKKPRVKKVGSRWVCFSNIVFLGFITGLVKIGMGENIDHAFKAWANNYYISKSNMTNGLVILATPAKVN